MSDRTVAAAQRYSGDVLDANAGGVSALRLAIWSAGLMYRPISVDLCTFMQSLLVPPFAYRSRDWSPVWTSFVGRRASNSVYGWPDEAFGVAWRTRRVLCYTVHLVSEPDAIGRILLDNKANYERPALVRRLLRSALGDGLFNAEGESWREQRRIVAPTFSPAAVAGFATPIAGVVEAQITGWPASARPIDMAAEATTATMAIIAATLFGSDARLTAPAAAGRALFARYAGCTGG